MKLILQVGILAIVVFLSLRRISGRPSWRDVGQCGSALACGPECQKLCLTQHNYYRALHNLPPLRCDPDLAESAQAWTDLQAQKGHLKRSPWRNLGQVAESTSWKQWGWEGMADTRASVPSAVRSWYSEMKGSIVNRTTTPEHYQTIVRPDVTRVGCGIHVIPGDGTYVTAHYGSKPGEKVLNDNIQIPAARKPEPACQIKSGEREKCGDISSPYMTPDVCIRAGCCYDDVFRDEPDVNWYSDEGSTWCYKGKSHDAVNKTSPKLDNNERSANTSMMPSKKESPKNQTSLKNNEDKKVKNAPPLGSGPTPTSPPGSTGAITGSDTSPTAPPPTGAITSLTTGVGLTTDMESDAGERLASTKGPDGATAGTPGVTNDPTG